MFFRFIRAAVLATWALVAYGAIAPASAQMLPADVETTVEKGFGRMVITFKNRNLLPQYVVKSSNGVLVIQFSEPVAADVERVPLTLGNFVTVGRRDPDGLALRFAMARQIKINTMDAGEKLFVDFLPVSWTAAPPALPDAVVRDLAKRADAALKAQREAENLRFGLKIMPKLDFRVGRQPTFTRFSFGWNVPFDTQMSRENDRVLLTFNRPATIDLTSVIADPPPGLREISADASDGKLRIVLAIAPEADVRAFREDQTYVLDLASGTARPDPVAAKATKGLTAAKGPMPASARNRIELPGSSEATMMAEADPATSVKTREVPLEAAPAPAAKPKPAEAKAAAPVSEARPAAEMKPSPKPAKVAAVPEARPAAEQAPPPAHPAAVEAHPVAEKAAPKPARTPKPEAVAAEEMPAEAPEQPAADAHEHAAEAHADTPPEQVGTGETRPEMHNSANDVPTQVRAEAKRVGNVVRIGFPFPQRVASAAFKRDSSLWLVFDSKLPIDIKAVQTALGAMASNVVVGKVDQAQTVRIDLAQPALTTMSADGTNWFLSIGEMILEPSRPLTLRRVFRSEMLGQLQVELRDAGAVHEIADPTVGDRMTVVTAYGPAKGSMKDQSFAEVLTLSTAHGLAVVPLADDVTVSLERDIVTISREKGLTLSPGAGNDRSEAPVPKIEGRTRKVAVDPASYVNHEPALFTQKIRQLQADVAEASDKEKTQKRLTLADFYISNRFAPEALGVLRLIVADEPGIERDPGFLVLFGAAQTMTGRFKEAQQVLTRPAVTDNADAALWRTIAAVGLQKWDEAREASLQASPAIGSYPPDIQAMFALAAAEASIELNDFGPAGTRLAEVQPDDVDADLAVKFEVLEARLMDAAGRPDDALSRLDRAVESTDRRGAADAEYRRLKILHRDGKITAAETIDRLKSLGFGWRGDEAELKSLRFLAKLQAASGQYRDAFNSMRSAVMVNGNAATTKALQDEMNQEFLSLFLDGKADTLPPIDALSLYYDFRDMTPIGRQGDEIVRNLADRLIGVDLLDQAAELLNYQVNNRLRGVAKAQIAADLAVVHLLNRKPDQALAILNKTRQSSLPASVERQRRLVEARALSETGRGELANELLGHMIGSDVDRMRVDTAWKAKNWRDASERLESMLGGRWNDQQPLDAQERQDVLKAAIGYALANDQLALDRLRTKFGPKMLDSPNSKAFDIVTAPIQSQGTEFRSIAKEIASIDTMRSFLDEYRQQYMNGRKQKADPKAGPKADAKPDQKPELPPGPAAALDKKPAKPTDVAQADPKTTEPPAH